MTSYDRNYDKKLFKISNLEKSKNLLTGILFNGFQAITTSENYLGDDFSCGDDCSLVVTSTEATPTFDDNIYKISKADNTVSMLVKDLPSEKIEEILNSNATDFVLSGWAKADSAWVNRRCTDYSDNNNLDTSLDSSEINDLLVENMDESKKKRRFELRAELIYENNGEQKIVEQYCSFDWMNTGWQYCAFPVTLSEDKNDKLVGLRVIFDYSNNTNDAEFFGMSLKEGLWEYSEYNNDKLITYYENSHTKTITTYEYDDKKLIKEIKIKDGETYSTTYKYDSKGALKRVTSFDGLVKENEYNDKGLLVKSYTYHRSEPSSRLYHNETILDDNGNNKTTLNEFGEVVSENTFMENSSLMRTSKLKTGTSIAYGYDYDDDSLLSSTINISNESNTNICGYNFNLLTSLSHNDFSYEYEYDGLGRQKRVSIAEQEYLSLEYSDTSTKYILASKEQFIKRFDDDGNLLSIEYINQQGESKIIIENIYDTFGDLLETKDYSNGDETIIYNIEYDKYGNANKKCYTQNYKKIKIETNTNVDENKVNETVYIDDKVYSTNYDYEKDLNAKLSTINFVDRISQNIFYDKLGRIKQTNLANVLTKKYNYLQKGDHSSSLISSEWFGNDKTLNDNLKYYYDDYGNIICVQENGIDIVKYYYDDLSRLIREDNKKLNSTTTYSYDKGGNIVEYYVYPYSTCDTKDLSNGNKYSYAYPINGWRDQLVSFNGELCEYDKLGNPTTYRNNKLVWSLGKHLTKFGDYEYKYNADGIRISKKVAGKTTHYYLDGTTILAQDDGNLLTFMYGIDGIIGFTYDGVGEYYYKKNIFGDIIGIFDKNAQEIVKYVYDAWGNHKTYIFMDGKFVDIATQLSYTEIGLNNKLIAEINPFRYRSYYYDSETNLYYLNSRYYDPETGRFISPDSVSYLDPQRINGLNLYEYCKNNPIMHTDSSGHFAITVFLISMAIGAVIGGVLGGITANANGQNLFFGILTGALLGAAVGAVIGAGGAALSGAVSSVLGKATTDLISVVFYGGKFGSWEDYATAFVFGGLTGTLGSVAGKFALFAKGTKFVADVAFRPLVNQLAKMGTRGISFDSNKYLYDIITRTVTFGGSKSIMKSNIFRLNLKVDLGKSFYRATFKLLYSYF